MHVWGYQEAHPIQGDVGLCAEALEAVNVAGVKEVAKDEDDDVAAPLRVPPLLRLASPRLRFDGGERGHLGSQRSARLLPTTCSSCATDVSDVRTGVTRVPWRAWPR